MTDSSSDEEEFVVLSLIQASEEEKRGKSCWVHEINVKRETFGEFHHLFEDLLKDDVKFFQNYRMSPEKFFQLHNLIADDISRHNTKFRLAISTEERLSVCLRSLSTGDTFRTIASSYRLGESTVRKIVYDCCKAIWKNLQPVHMPVPNEEMWTRIANEYETRWNFPNCIGAFDGKHVVFEKPAHSGSLFHNYKKTFSIVLLGLFDANYKFIYVDVGAMGKNSDGGIFSNSTFARKLQAKQLEIPADKPLPGTITPVPHVFVADEAFPLMPNLMRPFPGESSIGDRSKKIFNYRLSRARNTSEDAFGILSKKFRMYRRVMQMTPENLTTCVLATCVLHNFLREDCTSFVNDLIDEPCDGLRDSKAIGGNFSEKALNVRLRFKHYFNSTTGSVSWQDKAVSVGKRGSKSDN